jgi:hypothetical protein
MSSSGPNRGLWGDNSAAPLRTEFVSGGEVLIGKLVSTLLGSLWLTIAAGWITVSRAIVQIHVSLLNTVAETYSAIVLAFGEGAAEASRATWGAAFQAAVDASPLLAPVIFSVEIVVVSGLLVVATRRWT